jgi:hypothetical protein
VLCCVVQCCCRWNFSKFLVDREGNVVGRCVLGEVTHPFSATSSAWIKRVTVQLPAAYACSCGSPAHALLPPPCLCPLQVRLLHHTCSD